MSENTETQSQVTEPEEKTSIWNKPLWGKKKAAKRIDYTARVMSALPEEMRKRKPLVTILLMIPSIVMACIIFGKYGIADTRPEDFIEYGGNIGCLTESGQYWRLLASSFLHIDLNHLVVNMLCLAWLGNMLEKLIGSIKVICVYFISAFIGAVFSYLRYGSENAVCVGASGAVYGFLGAMVLYVVLTSRKYGIKVHDLFGYLKWAGAFLAINLAYSLISPKVDFSGHMGGLLAGIVIGVLLGLAALCTNLKCKNVLHAIVYLACCVIVTVSATSCIMADDTATVMRNKMPIDELKREVVSLIEKTMRDNAPGSLVLVDVEEFTLEHKGGEHYEGIIAFRLTVGMQSGFFRKKINVKCDGRLIQYQMENL